MWIRCEKSGLQVLGGDKVSGVEVRWKYLYAAFAGGCGLSLTGPQYVNGRSPACCPLTLSNSLSR